MTNRIKKLFLSVLVLVFASCKSNENPEGAEALHLKFPL